MKKKPLGHTEGMFDVFAPFTSGPVALFETAPESLAQQLVDATNRGDERARRWLDLLVFTAPVKKGLVRTAYSDAATLEQLVDEQAAKNTTEMFALANGRRLVQQRAYNPNMEHDIYATALLRVIHAGLLPRIRYCALAARKPGEKGCGKLFFGDPRARWCSAACGTVHRQRTSYSKHPKTKRKRNRQ